MGKVAVVLGCLAGWGLLAPCASSQGSGAGIIYFHQRQFRIPFKTDPGAKLKQFNLFVSTDQGRSWQPYASAPPEQGHFNFATDRDGSFWFAVQQVNGDGQLYPANMNAAHPSLTVVIDTQPPGVQLQPLPPRVGEVGVAWAIQDENPDLTRADALRLEYRPAGGQWLMLPVNPGVNQYYWNPQSNGIVEVRMRARDRAGNWGEGTTSVSLAGNPQVAPPNVGVQNPLNPVGPGEERRLVNSKRISLNYDVQEVGPSGISSIELWYTQDARSWNKYPQAAAEPNQKALVIEVGGEGIYGFSLLAKSGVGLGARPPQIGDRPQVWVEVDMTKPIVQLFNVIVGQGEDKGKLTVTWSAKDKNLGAEPITLAYAEQATGPWTPIVQNHANAGRHVWSMPERVPYQFFVKVSAVDQAGNVGEAATESVVKVDLSQPKAKITTVGPGN